MRSSDDHSDATPSESHTGRSNSCDTPSDESSAGTPSDAEEEAPRHVTRARGRPCYRTEKEILEDPNTSMFIRSWAEQCPSWSKAERDRRIWDILLNCPTYPCPGISNLPKLQLQLGGEAVTIDTFSSILKVSKYKVRRLLKKLEGRSDCAQ